MQLAMATALLCAKDSTPYMRHGRPKLRQPPPTVWRPGISAELKNVLDSPETYSPATRSARTKKGPATNCRKSFFHPEAPTGLEPVVTDLQCCKRLLTCFCHPTNRLQYKRLLAVFSCWQQAKSCLLVTLRVTLCRRRKKNTDDPKPYAP